MTETKATPAAAAAAPGAAATPKAKHKDTAADKAARGAFPTVEAAEASKPDNAKYVIFVVECPDGTTAYTWDDGAGNAAYNVARAHGYKARRLHPKAHGGPVSRGAVMESMTDAEVAALVAKRGLTSKALKALASTTAAPGAATRSEQ
jgi:hypothetical protein